MCRASNTVTPRFTGGEGEGGEMPAQTPQIAGRGENLQASPESRVMLRCKETEDVV